MYKNKWYKQKLWVNFLRDEKAPRDVIFLGPWLGSSKVEFNDVNVDDLLGTQHYELSIRVKNLTYEGSSWTLHSILWHKFFTWNLVPCEDCSYFSFPK